MTPSFMSSHGLSSLPSSLSPFSLSVSLPLSFFPLSLFLKGQRPERLKVFNLHYILRTRSPGTVTLGVRVSFCESGGHSSVYSFKVFKLIQIQFHFFHKAFLNYFNSYLLSAL
jgi:hypothetical protein